jgi:hypothetical protein
MPLRSCLVSCHDLAGTEHAVEVTAESLYEAVAQALGILRGDMWVEEIGEGLTELKVRVKQPAVEHRVRMKDFRRWLESQGKTPAECTRNKYRLKALLSVNNVVRCLTLCRDILVEKNRRAGVTSKDGVEKELLVFVGPNAPALVGRIKIKLFVARQVKQPGDILRGGAALHRGIHRKNLIMVAVIYSPAGIRATLS